MDIDAIAKAADGGDIVLAGTRRPASDGRTFGVFDPATTELIRRVSSASAADAAAAVDVADAASGPWRETPPRRRSEILHATFQAMREQAPALARLITLENGKAYRDALAEVGYAAEFFRWFAEESVRIGSSFSDAPGGGYRHVVRRRPAGITAFVTPWNFPAAMAARKIAPALAAGCPVLLKPAPDTPLTALAIGGLLAEAGLPEGVCTVLPTDRAADVAGTWLADDRIRKFSFTGSTATGTLLLKQAAERVVNVTMELGGNAPFIVCADADIDAAVRGAMDAKMRGGGEVCIAANRFYLHESIAEEFTAKFADAMTSVHIGPGLDEGVGLGPMINAAAVTKINDLVARRPACRPRPGAEGEGLVRPGDRAGRRTRGRVDPAHRSLRSGRAAGDVRRRGGNARACQRFRARPRRVRVLRRPRPRAAGRGSSRSRDGRRQPGADLRPRGPVRRGQAVRTRPGGWP